MIQALPKSLTFEKKGFPKLQLSLGHILAAVGQS